jgi:PEP-CTERM motif
MSATIIARAACAGFALAMLAGGAHAATSTFDTSSGQFTPGYDNHGWWSPTLVNSDTNTSYAAGYSAGSGVRNFFTFDLASLNMSTQQIVSATLQVRKYWYTGSDPSETFALFDVSTSPQVLNATTGASAAIFGDLGSGKSYGSVEISQAGATTDIITISLTGAALADIAAAAGGYFSIGGSCTTCTEGQNIFSASSATGLQRLVLETIPAVPEPSSYVLLGVGLALVAVLRRRRSAQAADTAP